MGLDIRLPLGLLFVVTGGMMTVYGLFTHGSAIYQKSMGIDINLVWGIGAAAVRVGDAVAGLPRSPPHGQCSAGKSYQ